MDDLKLIKKYYGEKMMHLCRDLFPTVLETPGLLYQAISSRFAPSRSLYYDIKKHDEEYIFKNIIYEAIDNDIQKVKTTKSAIELLKEAGYTLYECKTEADIQSFRHFYKRKDGKVPVYKEGENPISYNGEELCTFNGDRLDRCHVFWAVRDDAEELKREDFKNPQRQDEYGTSVLSIQFSLSKPNTVSIKNRYNHTVSNPDATFANNLDNIIPGLTDAFERDYNLRLVSDNVECDLEGYTRADDGKFYKYNCEVDGIFFCPDNIVIEDGVVHHYDKSRYIVMDYFILDLKEKTLQSYGKEDDKIDDSFVDGFEDSCGNPNIKSIKIENNKESKEKTLTVNDDIIIVLDEHNQIKKYKNDHIIHTHAYFLRYVREVEEIDLPKLKEIGDNFLSDAYKLKKVNLPMVESIGDNFLENNEELEKISLPKCTIIGDWFLYCNSVLEKLYLPKCENIGDDFLRDNDSLTKLDLPSVINIGDGCLMENSFLTEINLPLVESIGSYSFSEVYNIKTLDMPKLTTVGASFLCAASELEKVNLPELVEVGDFFLSDTDSLTEITLPKLEIVGDQFISSNQNIKSVSLPNCTRVGYNFLKDAEKIENVYLPKLLRTKGYFLINASELKELDLPKIEYIDHDFMSYGYALERLNIPKCMIIDDADFLKNSDNLKEINAPSLTSPRQKERLDLRIRIMVMNSYENNKDDEEEEKRR